MSSGSTAPWISCIFSVLIFHPAKGRRFERGQSCFWRRVSYTWAVNPQNKRVGYLFTVCCLHRITTLLFLQQSVCKTDIHRMMRYPEITGWSRHALSLVLLSTTHVIVYVITVSILRSPWKSVLRIGWLVLLVAVKTQPRMTTTVTTRVCSQALRFTDSSHLLSMVARRYTNDVDGWLIWEGSLTNTHTSFTSTQLSLKWTWTHYC